MNSRKLIIWLACIIAMTQSMSAGIIGVVDGTLGAVDSNLEVSLYEEASAGAELVVTSAIDGGKYASEHVGLGQKSATMSVGHLPSGIYVMTLSYDGVAVDSAKFTKR